LPHLVIAVTPDGEVVLRSNVSADVLRSFGEDLQNVADELEAPPKPGDTLLQIRGQCRRRRFFMVVLIGVAPIARKGPAANVAQLVPQDWHG
jgi:hypothetical protein